VLAEGALPLVAAPPESDEEELLDGVEVVVLPADVLVIDAVDGAVVVAAWVDAARPANAATATVPTTAEVVVSFLRRRRARSRSATVTRCLFTHLRMTASPVVEVRES
jgi:hypothetical protein